MSNELDALMKHVNDATGWANHAGAPMAMRRSEEGWSVSVKICGSDASVDGYGKTQEDALKNLLLHIELHHVSIAKWHIERRNRARAALDVLKLYYPKTNLESQS